MTDDLSVSEPAPLAPNHPAGTVGMMWFEPDAKTEPARILADGVAYFTRKYGTVPNLARVPLDWPDLNGSAPPGLTVERRRNILPRHVWLLSTQAGETAVASENPVEGDRHAD